MLTRAKPQRGERPRRFHKSAASGPLEGAWGVLLDGRPVRTPQGARLLLPAEPLAALIAAEWDRQGEEIILGDMPLTRLAFTAQDRVAGARRAVAEEAARYAGSDVLCYYAEGPASLVAQEHAAWEPLLGWAETELGLEFVRVTGLMHQQQPPATLERVQALALELDDFALTAFAHGAALYGSAVLALALQRGRLGGEDAFALSRLDERFQEERWGVDAEAAARSARMTAESIALGAWFEALAPGRGAP